MAQLNFPHFADSETITITPNLPSDNGYRYYQWTAGGTVGVGTDVWVNTVQDGWRDGQVPAVIQVNRDGASDKPLTVYYSLGGTAIHGVDNGDGTYTPTMADYTGGNQAS